MPSLPLCCAALPRPPCRPAGKYMSGRCERCPVLLPGTAYTLLMVAVTGKHSKLQRLDFNTTTAYNITYIPAPASSG